MAGRLWSAPASGSATALWLPAEPALPQGHLVGFMQAGSGRVLSICVAMFFVFAYTHTDIRRKIAAEEIFYLEYFYFLMYAALLWVCINSVLFARGTRIWLIQYRINLISQLAFWPC